VSFLKKLFERAESDTPSPEQQTLLERAKRTVHNYLENNKAFPLFAMALNDEGEITSFLPSEEFSNERDAFVGILKMLIPLARSGTITAAVLVTPMAPPEGFRESSAMFDLEQRGKSRFAVVLPYRSNGGRVEYGEITFRKMEPKLFPS
jgi:hypothetical protein